ncbi:MAG: hypothetical protein Q8R35_01000 [bacterium]|nr:hypothetical protein [bacterium]
MERSQPGSWAWHEERRRENVRTKILLLLLEKPTELDDISIPDEDFIPGGGEIGAKIGEVLRELRDEGAVTEVAGRLQLTGSMQGELDRLRVALPAEKNPMLRGELPSRRPELGPSPTEGDEFFRRLSEGARRAYE